MSRISQFYSSRSAPLVAFVILVTLSGIALNGVVHKAARDAATVASHVNYRGLLIACSETNSLRRESNARIIANKADNFVLREFLATAKKAREGTYRQSRARGLPDPADKQAAIQYGNYISELDAKVKFTPLPIIDCKKEIPRP